MVPNGSLSALKCVYLPTNCKLRNMTCSVDIFIRSSARAGRDGQRDIAKKTGYFDETFTFAKASKFKEKEGEES